MHRAVLCHVDIREEKMKVLVYSAFLTLLLAAVCTAQDPCSGQVSCDLCIAASHNCTWCPFPPNTSTPTTRCRLASTEPCPGDVSPEDPRPEVDIVKDEPLTMELETPSVQVSPQNISLSLRRDLPSAFNMTFRSLRNSPLDLYFLIDISSSQDRVVRQLRQDLPVIAESIPEISTNFRIGFGTFVDKATLPYAFSDYTTRRLSSGNVTIECRSFGECTPTYSFRNSQPLTPNVTQIAVSFNEASELSANIDSPEGTMEALLQVAICTNETGWRPDALHMVFVITDQGFHLAGDGKLAGIVRPNDGLCHQEIGPTGRLEYTYGLLQDYPSLFQIRKALELNLIVPIFTLRFSSLSEDRVKEDLRPSFERLIDDLSATQAQVILFSDESVVNETIRVIRTSYDTTVQNIRVNPPAIDGYTFSIEPVEGCETRQPGGGCQLQFDDEVTFEVTVTMDDCEVAGRSPRRVQLLGPPFSFTTIDLNPICQCPCTREGPEVNSNLCSSRGNLTCGLCDCDPYFGTQCECNETVSTCPIAPVQGMPGVSDQCGDKGNCTSCGTCRCFEGFFGDACQCTDADCIGGCGDGQCSCGAVGSIPTCVCPVAPNSGLPYFDNTFGNPGTCKCNPDVCFNPQFPNSLCYNTESEEDGRTMCGCDGCTCPSGFEDRMDNTCRPVERCDSIIETCIRCRLGDINNASSECANNCPSNFPFLGDDVMPANFSRDCDYSIGGCDYTVFIDFQGSMRLLSFTRLRCSNRALPWIITGSLVGAIIVLGILFLIILKILLMICDRVEYKKFTQELQGADFSPMDNPLYLTPQQDYQNPIRRSSSKRVPVEQ